MLLSAVAHCNGAFEEVCGEGRNLVIYVGLVRLANETDDIAARRCKRTFRRAKVIRLAPTPVPLIVTQVVNATGSAGYRPLARASQEVITGSAQRMKGIQVFRDGADPEPGGSITLVSRLIIWNGRPAVMMSAQDGRGAVIWTGMTSGKERLIPHEVSAAMRELEAAVHG